MLKNVQIINPVHVFFLTTITLVHNESHFYPLLTKGLRRLAHGHHHLSGLCLSHCVCFCQAEGDGELREISAAGIIQWENRQC